jgi:hypothetical protein
MTTSLLYWPSQGYLVQGKAHCVATLLKTSRQKKRSNSTHKGIDHIWLYLLIIFAMIMFIVLAIYEVI